ncbi:hypothetical protein B296_00010580 [Ensete ventricosum]|uniref:Uncharacterized protein n=1 Tax=Ensete ventricosum TaxID=4639 RepID=A0A427AQ79_ENSVE|nr:hypothetical protein B296_00010580 [Ensete ventricosum]
MHGSTGVFSGAKLDNEVPDRMAVVTRLLLAPFVRKAVHPVGLIQPRCGFPFSSLRLERDKWALEANFAKDHFDGLKKEIEHQRKEANAVSARNVELTQLVVDFQKRLRECSNSLQETEENARKLSMEWAEAKRELQEERDRVRALTNEKENALEASINQLQEMKKELAEAWSAVASAESRAAVAEAERVKKALEGEVSSLRDRVSELEKQYVRLFFSLFVFLLPRLRSLFFFFSLFFFLPPSAVTAQNQSAMVEIDRYRSILCGNG